MISARQIQELTREELRQLWLKLLSKQPPAQISQTLMRQILAFECQCRTRGKIDRKTLKAISKLQQQKKLPITKCRIKPGSQLIREWHGHTHTVDVNSTGFIWKGDHFRSLSAIAYKITGTRWSGPRFFGLAPGGKA